MAQKFIGLDDAAAQLGVPKERLNELREAGQLRAYRDGASWKFRSDDINKLQETGLPSVAQDSAIGPPLDEPDADDSSLGLGDFDLDSPAGSGDSLGLSGLELSEDVGDSIELEPGPGVSDPDLEAVEEPTVAADEPLEELEAEAITPDADDDLVLDLDGSGDDAESILLSEAEIGDSGSRPPSTIIGKSEAVSEEDDLELAASDTEVTSSKAIEGSDVMLADTSGVLSEEASGSEVIPGAGTPPSGKFEDLEELEIDLEAESSRILEAEDVAAAQAAQKAQQEVVSAGESDLSLAPSDSDAGLSGLSGIDLEDESKASDVSLTGMSSLEVENNDKEAGSSLSGLSSIELADDEDDDFVLGDSGSDVTLSGADSGINLVPSDSGIALDEASQILGGSAIGSSIDLGELSSASGASGVMSSGELSSGDDFLLTPIGEEDSEEDEDSSQIIALDAVEEGETTEDSLLGGAAAMDLGASEATGFAAPSPASAPVAAEATFPIWIMALLGSCLAFMIVCGIMMVAVVRNIWSWEQPWSTSSDFIDGLLAIFGK